MAYVLTIEVPRYALSLLEEVHRIARADGRPVSAVIRDLIRAGLALMDDEEVGENAT